jgi:5S rRNA maturation endonuclease (ribonuclease M5)
MTGRNKERILELIDKARKQGILLIVEGQKDKRSLEQLGLENIFVIKKGSLPEAIEKIMDKGIRECIILTDFDNEGRKLYYLIKKELVKNGIKINDKLREELIKERLSHIEGLDTFLSQKFT